MADVYPNNDTYLFCQWILNDRYTRFTPARITVVTNVSAAALAGTSVTEYYWNQFLDITNRVYQPWLQSVALTTFPMWTDISGTSTVVGWSSTTTLLIWYNIQGAEIFIKFTISGTSNSATTTFTIPRLTHPVISSAAQPIRIADLGINAVGVAACQPATNLVQFYKDISANTFTATGTKSIQGIIVLPLP